MTLSLPPAFTSSPMAKLDFLQNSKAHSIASHPDRVLFQLQHWFPRYELLESQPEGKLTEPRVQSERRALVKMQESYAAT